ncbi:MULTISPECIES: LysR family transcriptional regulator [unclassified Bradyrhizobium]|uniref:LysR family transcriptional regulator n=1 Tax=unclassified Bradyrhizobium TaxID=2631580 RepID=UPI002478394D|nr:MULTISPECIES: LysR family transcriptional regulator [unclassified Bradyrhizobium]WGR68462.1 LysR substrate-binding domain-containing protein [Bradyrhizobium sp. ISRA426]WGR80517.1 LysR substrate-binding domain-containing protein [Bradyrhizobium sp. ISRA430]WGR83702.1 LysR substrate-binding domain-containing protein [Bradyrhizobium sp. ISRA432]
MTAPDLDPDLLKAFLAVAEHRSFTRAAAVLNRTQSAVSVQIRRLEERLGTRLFHRTRAGVAPTSAGEELLGYARRILALNAEAVGAVRARKIDGVVRLGVMDDYGTIVIPPLLASFAKSHPQVRVEIETGLTATMPARLGEAYDLVIAMHPQGRGDGELLRREQAVWAATASYPAQAKVPLPVALYPPGCLFRQWAAEALDAAGRPWRLAFVSRTLAAVEAIAAQGLAVTVVKAGTLPARLRRLCERDGLPPLPAADIRLHRARNLSRSGALLADHLCWSISESAPIC